MKKIVSLLLALVLALSLCACGASANKGNASAGGTTVTDGATLGEGAVSFTLEIRQLDGSAVSATVNTDAETVGDALTELGILEGEEGPYGIYIKSINGVTADYDVDQSYWSLTKDGVMCSGVDSTPIADGDHFELTYTK